MAKIWILEWEFHQNLLKQLQLAALTNQIFRPGFFGVRKSQEFPPFPEPLGKYVTFGFSLWVGILKATKKPPSVDGEKNALFQVEITSSLRFFFKLNLMFKRCLQSLQSPSNSFMCIIFLQVLYHPSGLAAIFASKIQSQDTSHLCFVVCCRILEPTSWDSQVTSHVLGPRGGTPFFRISWEWRMKDLDPVFLLKKAGHFDGVCSTSRLSERTVFYGKTPCHWAATPRKKPVFF